MSKGPDQYSDIELFEQLKLTNAQAEAAFTELYTRHSSRVFAYCRRILGDPSEAQDVFQDTFLRFYQSAKKTEEMTNIPAYLLKIARNLCLNCIRNNKKSVSFEEYHKLSKDPSHEKTELLQLIMMSLELLPFDYREAFVLREYDGLSYAEIAEVVDATLSTVKIRVHRAKQKIREILAPYLVDLSEE
jgi:RNA polymerase sigma-70 factor, ECF subfamily